MDGIYIPNMDMPTEGTVIAIYKLKGKFYARMHRGELCPLIPVTDHGRLIDADAIVDKIINYSKHIQKDILKYNWYDMCAELITQLALAPTVIPANEEGDE